MCLEAFMEVVSPALLVSIHLVLHRHKYVRVTDSNDETLGSGDDSVEDTGTAQALGRVEGTP